MSEHKRSIVLTLTVGLLGLVTIVVLNLLAQRSVSRYQLNQGSREPVALSPVTLPGPQQDQADSHLQSSSNVLELRKASLDFVGCWGGSVRSSESLIGEDSGHVGVVFGRRGEQVFFASKLYTPAGQHMIGKPLVRMAGPREALVEYQSEDDQVEYQYSHRFRLLNSGKIAYKETVRLYERQGHHFLGVAEQHSLLRRFTNIEEWRSVVRPGPDDVREGDISAEMQLRSSR